MNDRNLSKLPDLRLLSQFLTVCDAQSMTAAAQQMGVSTAAVSQALQRLEADIGVPLLERGPQGVRVTPAGAELRDRARALLERAEETMEALRPYQARAIPRLRLYVLESAASYLIPSIIMSLDKAVGELSVNSGNNPHYAEDLLRGRLDILISGDEFPGIDTIDRWPLCREKLVILAPAGLPDDLLTVQALCERLPLLRITRGKRVDNLVTAYLEEMGLDPPRRVEAFSASPILDLIGRGYGWTITTPLSVCYHKPERDKVRWLAVPQNHYSRDLFLFAEKDRLLDVPGMLAKQCHRALRAEVKQWSQSLPPEAADAIAVFDRPVQRLGRNI
ncbi:LysR family transcriptional regulator [Microvirga pudoricolor]|uniref:LysR family transcriptional regulator n=1 Tax=Microvirga pudoricolor TaxID=2778729 RepID=UPI001950ADDB|nr:LysR family transcriptional regulator [Microvirga pudoricolor]MBM6595227.1 LysR family transcriptional regulator [Microvirga pudoricolor]